MPFSKTFGIYENQIQDTVFIRIKPNSDIALEFSCNSFYISGNSNDAVFLIQGTTTLVDTLRLDFDIDAIRF